MPLDQLFVLKIGCAHRDPQSFCLIRARDETAVVIREHHDGDASKFWVKHPLARDVEVVAVDEGEGMRIIRLGG